MTGAPTKLIGFGAALAVVFGLGFGVARAVSPSGLTASGDGAHTGMSGMDHGGSEPSKAKINAVVPGLAVEQGGYRLVAEATTLASSSATPFSFRIDGPDGRPLLAYEQLHERELHLIVVRRDLSGFQHVHPTRAANGTWSIGLDLRGGGTWRAFADLAPKGGPAQLTLGIDLQVPGDFTPASGPGAAAVAPPGLDVGFERKASAIQVTVKRDGKVVDPEPYLGAQGHLVALRAGDLAYLHVHPEASQGSAVKFNVEAPTNGSYALFFDYKLDGQVHTATTTMELPR